MIVFDITSPKRFMFGFRPLTGSFVVIPADRESEWDKYAASESWRDNTRWLLRAILGAIITSMIIGAGALLWAGFVAKAQGAEPKGTAALSSPLGATNDHTSFTLGANPRNPVPVTWPRI